MTKAGKAVGIKMGTGSSLTNIGICAPDEPNFVAIEMESGSSLTSVEVENAAIGAYARDVTDVSITSFKYRGGGRAFDITGERASITGSRIQTVSDGSGRSSIGYTKPNGPPLPAQCPDCKSIFPSKHYNVAIPRFLVKNNLETCPVCGGNDATLAEGLFELVGAFTKAIEADKLSHDLLRSIGAIAESVTSQSTSIDIEEAINKIAVISPAAAAVLKRPQAQKLMSALFLLFLSIASLNQLADFNEKYHATEFAGKIYTAMSQYIVESVGAHESEIQDAQEQEHPRIANPQNDQMRKHRNHLNNSTAIPQNIPIPTPRPTRPKPDGENDR
ncbi:hypothetical protein [Sinorhizobium meliloti]|uniref:hypothetical protein n=1 Tax=Rhizobium meliloti TaxID=382 RepID=UPI000FDA649E|nr:hypothetical protein [Sinorhizobium meliloti]RVG50576.1 hypothetical protein CN226_21710 [Sinorhizobium meliloti]